MLRLKIKKIIIILSVPLFAFLSVPVLGSIPAYASPSPDWGKDPTKMVKGWLYYKALRWCIADGWFAPALFNAQKNEDMTQENAVAYEWFNGTHGTGDNYFRAGAILDPTASGKDGILNCGGDEGKGWIKDMVKHFGYANGPAMLCDIGFYRTIDQQKGDDGTIAKHSDGSYTVDASNCTKTDSAGNDFRTYSSTSLRLSLLDAAMDNVFKKPGEAKSADPTTLATLTEATQYTFYRDSFIAGACGEENDSIKLHDSIKSPDYKLATSALDGNDYGINDMDDSNQPVTKLYRRDNPSVTSGTNIAVYNNIAGVRNISCKDLAKEANKLFGSYKQDVESGDITAVSGNTSAAGGQSDDGDATSCAVLDGLGWIVCPVLNAVGGISDAMYGWIESILLLNPLQMYQEDGTTPTNEYLSWQRIRDISNVLLVIAFLIVIFSQLTGIGVSNYGIKKLLPRVILVAILVNISFLVMMISIDAVNLIGKGLYDVLVGLAPNVTGDSISDANAFSTLTASLVAGAATAGGLIAAGAIIGPGTLALLALPFLAVAALALLAAIATLFVRNALVIVLVLVAPLAFAAFMLPNTKSLFDRWRKLLVGVLFLYPTAALLFGGTKFAAYTLASSDQPFAALIALFVMAAPLGLLPWLAASSGGILGSIGGKLQGMAKSVKAPLQGVLKSRVDNQRAGWQDGERNAFGRKRDPARAEQRRDEIAAGTRRRNLGEYFAQNKAVRETDTETHKTGVTQNAMDRGRLGTSRSARRYSQVFADQGDMGVRKEGNAAEQKALTDARIADPTTRAARYDTQKHDAGKASAVSQGITNERNEERIKRNDANVVNGVGLQDQASAVFGTDNSTKANEGEILNVAHATGVADAAIDQQKANELTKEELDTKDQAAFDDTLVTDKDRAKTVMRTEGNKIDSSVSRGKVDARIAAAKDTGGKLFKREVQRQALEDKKNRSEEHTKQVIDEARTDKGSRIANLVGRENRDMLQQEKKRREEIRDATNSAQLVQRSEYAERLMNDPAVPIIAGGIDDNGPSRVKAGAVAQVRSERTKAIDNHVELFAHEQYDPVDLLDSVANDRMPDGSVPNAEQLSAAVKFIMTKGTNEQQMQLYDIMEGGEFHQTAPDPTDPTKRFVVPNVPGGPSPRTVPTEVLQDLATFSATSKIQSVGGSYQNDLNTGKGIPGYDGLIVNRVQGGKLTKEKFANMDIDEMMRYARLAKSGNFGNTSDPTVMALKKAIDEARGDKNINRYFDKEKNDALDAILLGIKP